jgi:hypothetical protein
MKHFQIQIFQNFKIKEIKKQYLHMSSTIKFVVIYGLNKKMELFR